MESMSCKSTRNRGISCKFGAIVGLQFLTQASFSFMSPIISILMTEYFARLHSDGLPIDCGSNPHNQTCVDGSRQAAWLSSVYLGIGSVLSFVLCPMIGQASDVYGRKILLVLSQIARVGLPFSVMYFMEPHGSITPYFVLSLIDNAFETGGVMNAAAADIVSPDNRATAFGLLSASIVVGYCSSAFMAPFFARENILQIAAGIFVLRVVWAMLILPETLPVRTRMKKTRWVVENPFSSISILFCNRLFIALTCLIALTSFVSEGIFQIQSFYLNVVVGFDVTDFGNLILFNGILAIIGQGLLLDPLVKCTKEKGVVIMALVGCFLKAFGIVCTAFYPRKWLVYVLCVPGCMSELSFPAISALMSINTAEEEQGRLQGAIYGARSVFAAIGPVIFSLLYTAMTKKSEWSRAFPFVVASCIYFIEMGVAISLPVDKVSSYKTASPASTNLESDEDNDMLIEGAKIDQIFFVTTTVLDDDQSLMEPLLKTKSATRYSEV